MDKAEQVAEPLLSFAEARNVFFLRGKSGADPPWWCRVVSPFCLFVFFFLGGGGGWVFVVGWCVFFSAVCCFLGCFLF